MYSRNQKIIITLFNFFLLLTSALSNFRRLLIFLTTAVLGKRDIQKWHTKLYLRQLAWKLYRSDTEEYFTLSFSSKDDRKYVKQCDLGLTLTTLLCFFVSPTLSIGNCVPATVVSCEWTPCSRSTDWKTCCRSNLISPTKAARGPIRTCTASKLVSEKLERYLSKLVNYFSIVFVCVCREFQKHSK